MAKKGLLASIGFGGAILGFTLIGLSLQNKYEQKNLPYTVFENANTCQVESGGEGIWEFYKESNLEKSGPNWRSYFYRAYELNNGNLKQDSLFVPCDF